MFGRKVSVTEAEPRMRKASVLIRGIRNFLVSFFLSFTWKGVETVGDEISLAETGKALSALSEK